MKRTPRHTRILLFAISAISLAATASATTYALERNEPVLISDESGRCYARSTPSTGRGLAGVTKVFEVRRGDDWLIHRFPWYSSRLAIGCGSIGPRGKRSVSIVRMGRSWASKTGETSGSVTLAFYLDGALVAEYSSVDIAMLPDNAGGSYGRNRGYGKVLGFRRSGRRDVFEICSDNNRILTFDILNGDLVGEYNDHSNRCGTRR